MPTIRNSLTLFLPAKTYLFHRSFSPQRFDCLSLSVTESFLLRPLLKTEGASQNDHQSVSRCPQADWKSPVGNEK